MFLPVESVLDDLGKVLSETGRAVLCAAPGAGKTTAVPQFLLKRLFSGSEQKIVMLEPRRIAARTAARRIASLLNERTGQTVGYRTRLDTCISKSTRIEIVTEGILTRMLQNDPALEQYGLIIFDEFHERSIHADLALALALDSVNALRPDLKILIMSATLDADRVSALLGHAPIINAPGKMFPVKTLYLPGHGRPVWVETASAVRQAVASGTPGDLLVFLPGEGEIHRTMALLEVPPVPDSIVYPLYGNLSPAEQDAVLSPESSGRRKIILATSIAETSLTINGVATVIDSGLMRIPKFSPRNGMNRLETVPVSLASADQRRGRAGRTQSGVCIRMWSQAEESRMFPFSTPGILEADLAQLVLELAGWGIVPAQAATLQWLDAPPDSKLKQAAELLSVLGALDPEGHITEHGRRLLELPVHPRLGHAVLLAKEDGFGFTACRTAALLTEKEPVRETCDLCSVLNSTKNDRRLVESALQIACTAGIRDCDDGGDSCVGPVLAMAYPDRIGHWRTPKSGEYALSNGTGAKLRFCDYLASSEYIAAASVEGEGAREIIYSAAPVTKEDLYRYLSHLIHKQTETEWDPEHECVTVLRTERLGKMLMSAVAAPAAGNTESTAKIFFTGLRSKGISALPFTPADQDLRDRVQFVRHWVPDSGLPDLSDQTLLDSMENWLAPFTEGFMRLSQLKKLNMNVILSAMLTRKQMSDLSRLAPERISVPTGSKIKVDYSQPDGVPSISVRLQELFGMLETPRIADGRVPVVIKMLSPAMRPVQITSDLRSFWNESYFLVRKDLRGRYPKHYWPENPLEAEPTRRTKPH